MQHQRTIRMPTSTMLIATRWIKMMKRMTIARAERRKMMTKRMGGRMRRY
jgi:hypothetical protein